MNRTITIGVEEEFQVVDPVTRRTAGGAEGVLAAVKPGGLDPEQFESEIHATMVETCTAVCRSLPEIADQVVALRAALKAAAKTEGLAVAAAGTLPNRGDADPIVRHEQRYEEIQRLHAGIVSGMSTCGVHVHVGVDDRDVAVGVINRVRRWLPALLALSGNSPYWDGRDSGFASYRTVIWGRWPSASVPEPFTGAEQYDKVVAALIDSGATLDAKQVYWDVRLSPAHPTLEYRIADVPLTVEETVLQAGLCAALTETARREIEDGAGEHRYRPELLRAAKWRAARFGVGDQLLNLDVRKLVSAGREIHALLDHVAPVLCDWGEEDAVRRTAERVLRGGNGAQRQRGAFDRRGSAEDVVDAVLAET